MKSLLVLAVVLIASPAFAQAPAKARPRPTIAQRFAAYDAENARLAAIEAQRQEIIYQQQMAIQRENMKAQGVYLMGVGAVRQAQAAEAQVRLESQRVGLEWMRRNGYGR